MTLPGITQRQLANAQAIVTAAVPFGREAAVAAVMTAIAESSLLRYANNGKTTRMDVPLKWRALAAISQDFPHDAVAGEAWTTADSLGMYQQRLMYGYSSPDRAGVAALMDITESTRIFLRGSTYAKTKAFLESPKNLSLAQRCQWAQGSEYPTGENYAPHESLARRLVDLYFPTEQKDWLDMATKDEVKAAFAEALADFKGQVVQAVHDDLVSVLRADEFKLSAARIADQVWSKDWPYENQDPNIPADKQARDTADRAIQAGNGEVYRMSALLKRVAEKLGL